MRKLFILGLAMFFLGYQSIQAQNCDTYEIKLNKQVQTKNYKEAYPILKEALQNCASEKVNYYNFGEIILDELAKDATNEADKKKYAQDLIDLLDKRIQYFAEDKKAFWEGERISYMLNYNLIDKQQAYDAFTKLFNSSEDTQKVSANTVLLYYTTALELLNEDKIDFNQALDVYFKTKKVAEDNIELRSIEYGKLAEKLDSIQKINPQNQLTAAEQQIMENAQSAKNVFVDVNQSMEAILKEYTTCDNIAPMFINNFEANKDSIEWLKESYASLASNDCYDLPIMQTIEDQYKIVWKKQNPQEDISVASSSNNTSSTIGSDYADGARKFKAGNYSGAITSFQKAIDQVSGTTKGDVAYYIALSYQKTGSLSNAVSWAKRAASYKPGFGAPYQLIAGIFGSNANSCGSSQFEKLSAYWVAADYANKACAVDSRSCSWARKAANSYEATAPNQEMAFQNGKKKGESVSINCFGGATTRVR